MFDYNPKPEMTGPEHVREAMRLATLANAREWPMAHGDFDRPTEDERHRMLVTAHLHASLARTAALTDSTDYYRNSAGGIDTCRLDSVQGGWNDVFNVNA